MQHVLNYYIESLAYVFPTLKVIDEKPQNKSANQFCIKPPFSYSLLVRISYSISLTSVCFSPRVSANYTSKEDDA